MSKAANRRLGFSFIETLFDYCPESDGSLENTIAYPGLYLFTENPLAGSPMRFVLPVCPMQAR
jgi:hypothetical protein